MKLLVQDSEVLKVCLGTSEVKKAYYGDTLVYKGLEGIAISIPKIASVEISENPTTVNTQITITVQVTTETKILPQENFYAGEIYAGEV